MVVFSGPHAYVSPRWYEEQERVPTWNYAAVHAYGVPKLIEDQKLKHASQRAPGRDARSAVAAAVRRAAPGVRRAACSTASSTSRSRVTRLETRWKLSQNRSRREQELIAAELEKSRGLGRARAGRADAQAPDRRVKVVVMGAGLAGVTTAWYLAKEGHEVVVIDREPRGRRGGELCEHRHHRREPRLSLVGRRDRPRAAPLGAAPGPGALALGHAAPPPEDRRLATGACSRPRCAWCAIRSRCCTSWPRDRFRRSTRGVLYLYREARGARRGVGARRPRCATLGFAVERLDRGAGFAARAGARCVPARRRAVCAGRRGRPTRRASAASSPRAAARSASTSTWRTRSSRSSRWTRASARW